MEQNQTIVAINPPPPKEKNSETFAVNMKNDKTLKTTLEIALLIVSDKTQREKRKGSVLQTL